MPPTQILAALATCWCPAPDDISDEFSKASRNASCEGVAREDGAELIEGTLIVATGGHLALGVGDRVM